VGVEAISRFRANLLREVDRASLKGGSAASRKQLVPSEFREGGDEDRGSASKRGSVNWVSPSNYS
jgi:hypothetical protein